MNSRAFVIILFQRRLDFLRKGFAGLSRGVEAAEWLRQFDLSGVGYGKGLCIFLILGDAEAQFVSRPNPVAVIEIEARTWKSAGHVHNRAVGFICSNSLRANCSS